MELSKFQKFTVKRINRDQIKNAEYNPRRISDKNKKTLKNNLKKNGLVQPIIWNERTGNIVGGHQRLKCLDELENNSKFALDVSVVNLDEKQEKEMNIFLNNTNAMGEFDTSMLKDVMKDIDIENAGYEVSEIFDMFGGSLEQLESKELETLKGKLADAYKIQEEISKNIKVREETDFYTVFIFKDSKSREKCHKMLGLSESQYQDGKFLESNK